MLIIVACLAASAFFSGSETALFRLRSHELEGEGKEAVGPADVAVRDLLASSSRLLVTILLGNNVVNILGASVASGLAIYLFGVEVGIPVATIVMTISGTALLGNSSEGGCGAAPSSRLAIRRPSALSLSPDASSDSWRLRSCDRAAGTPGDGCREGEEPLGSEEVLRLARAGDCG